MQAKTKSALILGSTLLLGALLGALMLGWFTHDRMRHIPHPRYFSRAMERMIQPENGAQREAVRAVVERYHQGLREIDEQHREALKEHMDSLLVELKPLLTEGQWRRVERGHQRFRELMGPWREGRGGRGWRGGERRGWREKREDRRERRERGEGGGER